MRKIVPILFIAIVLCYGCSKEHLSIPTIKSSQITVKPIVEDVVNSTWQQVLGGKGTINFTPVTDSTLNITPVADSLNFSKIASYSKQVFDGSYNITLKTTSTAVADTFIRFNSALSNYAINQDGAISFPATTTDGVITINKSLVDTTMVPTFTPAGATGALKFGNANGNYFIYVSDSTTGRVSFVEAASGYTYLADITVSALNQYDLLPILNTFDISTRVHPFHLKANIKY